MENLVADGGICLCRSYTGISMKLRSHNQLKVIGSSLKM